MAHTLLEQQAGPSNCRVLFFFQFLVASNNFILFFLLLKEKWFEEAETGAPSWRVLLREPPNFFACVFGFLNVLFLDFFHFFIFHGSYLAFGPIFFSKKQFARKKHVSFSSARGMILLLLWRDAQFCFREWYGCAFVRDTAVSLGNVKKKIVFLVFFFREMHGFACARGRVVLS